MEGLPTTNGHGAGEEASLTAEQLQALDLGEGAARLGYQGEQVKLQRGSRQPSSSFAPEACQSCPS